MDHQHKRAFKNELYEQFARLGKAWASPRRLEILDLLAQGERTVEELANEMDMAVASASQHLQILRAVQLVEVRREGVFAFYRLADEQVSRVWQAIRELAEDRLAEIDRIVHTYLQDRGSMQAIGAAALLQRLQEGDVVVLDVRPAIEYGAGHIPQARSVPLDELEARLREIPLDQEVVAYCRGPYCVFADEAVALLRAHGYQAHRLAQGLPEWRALGLPVESAPKGVVR